MGVIEWRKALTLINLTNGSKGLTVPTLEVAKLLDAIDEFTAEPPCGTQWREHSNPPPTHTQTKQKKRKKKRKHNLQAPSLGQKNIEQIANYESHKTLQNSIVAKSNKSPTRSKTTDNVWGGKRWVLLVVSKLKAYLAINLNMRIKRIRI